MTTASVTQSALQTRKNAKREVYYTPETAFQLIEPYIGSFKTIWDPAAGVDIFPVRDYFEKKGHRVIITDISMGEEFDFRIYKNKKRFDIIVTTPPYSERKEFIIRVCELKKAFALLVPVNVLESKTIRDLLKKYQVSFVFPPRTVPFSSPNDSRSVKNLPYSMWLVGGVPNMPEITYL